MTAVELSNCCEALPLGEIYKGFGRCSYCFEMSDFREEI